MTDSAQYADELLRSVAAASSDAIVSITLDDTIDDWNPAAERLFGYAANEAIGRPISMLFPPGHDQDGPSPTSRPSRGEPAVAAQTLRAHKDGRLLDLNLTFWSLRDADGQQIRIVQLYRDASTKTAQHHTGPVDAHRLAHHQLRALTRVSASLTFDQPMEATLDALAAGVVEVTQAVACAVALIDEENQLYRVAGTFGLPRGYAASVEDAYRAGAILSSLEAYRTLHPIHRSARDYIHQDPHQLQVSAIIRNEAWDSIVSFPLIFHNRAVGAVTFFFPIGIEPDTQELAFLGVVADQAAVAVQTARLFADLQGKVALEERQRLARELHDSVSQALFGIGLGARTARTLLDRDPSKAAEPLDYVIQLAEAGLSEMRALIFELRPDALETEGLVRLLEQQAAALRGRHGLHVETDFGPEPALTLPVKEMLYRIAQEAVHNTTKHARAQKLSLSLRQQQDGTVLEVIDDGIGFNPSDSFPGHLGLRSMRERVALHGATIEISSSLRKGTRTRILVPLQ